MSKPVPEMEALSTIVKDFNELFGNIDWKNRDEVQRQINELPARIAGSVDFANAVKNGDSQVAQITFNDDMIAIVAAMLEEKTICADLFRQQGLPELRQCKSVSGGSE